MNRPHSTPLPVRHHLELDFPDVHAGASLHLTFQRTLRIPEDGREWPLPAGFGGFPIVDARDVPGGALPQRWFEEGAHLLPMYPNEAMWISLSTRAEYRVALRVATGGIDAVSGEPVGDRLIERPQNYLVVPEQPWLDGYCVAKGRVRQFVAARQGSGRTVEEKLTGSAETGGIQLVATPMKAQRFEAWRARRPRGAEPGGDVLYSCVRESAPVEMGLAAGGTLRQEIYRDPHGIDAWEEPAARTLNLRIVHARDWHRLTGLPMPHPPITREAYRAAGIPWFDWFDEELGGVEGGKGFVGL